MSPSFSATRFHSYAAPCMSRRYSCSSSCLPSAAAALSTSAGVPVATIPGRYDRRHHRARAGHHLGSCIPPGMASNALLNRAFLYDTYCTERGPIYAVRYVFCRASTCYTGGYYEDRTRGRKIPGKVVQSMRNTVVPKSPRHGVVCEGGIIREAAEVNMEHRLTEPSIPEPTLYLEGDAIGVPP